MANSFTVGRSQLIFALCLPLAILLGYILSDPLDSGNTLVVLLMIGLLSVPLLMRGYHAALVFAWNAAITPVFLPGQPFVWVPLAFIGFSFAVINRFTNSDVKLISVPSLIKPLLFLTIVVLCTSFLGGGFGLRSFGSANYGGRNYFYILGAIAGYFALSSQRIQVEKVNLFVGLYFLTGLTSLIPNLAYIGGKSWYFLFYLFPPLYAFEQALGDVSPEMEIVRVLGLSAAGIALFSWVMARYGLRRILNWRSPYPLFLFLLAMGACAFCGFRTILLIVMITLALQVWFEGLLGLRALVLSLCSVVIAGGVIFSAGDKLPLVVQRSISFLPIRLDPVVELSARGSNQWRLDMWEQLLPEVPKYLLKGKGFGIDPTELAFASYYNERFGYGSGTAAAIASGDYHNGPLSLIISLGVWGLIGFTWFAIASIKYLFRQYRYGDPALRIVNTFLLVYFISRLIVFTFLVGSFFSDLFLFTGIVGLSVSLNGTGAPRASEPQLESRPESAELGELAIQR